MILEGGQTESGYLGGIFGRFGVHKTKDFGILQIKYRNYVRYQDGYWISQNILHKEIYFDE